MAKRPLCRQARPGAKRATALAKSSPRDVAVRASTLKGAGQGLFAARDFAKATLLPAPYKGRRLTYEQFARLKDFRWCFQVEEGSCWAVDGKALKRGNPLRYVNGARTPAQRRRVNVVGVKLEDGEAWYATTRAVAAGEEFLIDYGPGYWQAYEAAWGKPEKLRQRLRELRAELRQAGLSQRKRRELEEAAEDAEDDLEALGVQPA